MSGATLAELGVAPAGPRFKSIIIVTYGRSGSTLLQGILNTIPGFLIRGENYSVTDGLFEAWKSMRRGLRRHDIDVSEQPSHPWFGIGDIDPELFERNLARLMYDMLVPAERAEQVACYGFKEIRYPDTKASFNRYLGFLRLIMPDLAFIINTRRLENVAKSGWWAEQNSESVVAELTKREKRFLKYAEANSDHTFHVQYEDTVGERVRLRAMHDFLGVPYDDAAVDGVLGVVHSNVTAERAAKKAVLS
jgi:hypothetical protein